jgi:hypothetical protein
VSDAVLWTLKEAAAAVRVSENFLRMSACVRVYLPSNVPNGRPMLRFRPDDVVAWAEAHSTRAKAS